MLFSSPSFLFLFLPLMLAAYFAIRPGLRNLLLLIASLGFYAWGEKQYIAVLLVSIAINYAFGVALERWRDSRAARAILVLAVVANLALIAAFKYANFLAGNLNLALAPLGLGPIVLGPVHLPLGISFFTFQALSYVVDIYRRDVKAQRNLIDFAMYKALFPQLIAGPIVRYRDVAGEIDDRRISMDDFAEGARRFILGLAKKMLLANPLALAADRVFGDPGAGIAGVPTDSLTAGLAWLGIICYSLQIYFDFSGYSDMAIGLGRMLGFRFPENFNYPYAARSVTEFWRRWHMSLSSWFRDYLYIPLGGNRLGPTRTYFNLVVVFALCGLWHGASWTFILWGLMHGAFLVAERMGLGRLLDKTWTPLRHAYLLLAVVVTWVVFRAETPGVAAAYLAAMAGFARGNGITHSVDLVVSPEILLALAVGSIAALPIRPWLIAWAEARVATASASGRPRLSRLRSASLSTLSIAVLMALLVASAAELAAGTHNPFIYFRF